MSEIVNPIELPVPAVPLSTTTASPLTDDGYDRFLADLWVGVVLAIMVLSCVGGICLCFLYHTFKQWQARTSEERRQDHLEGGYDSASLPSYTVVGGLPSYEEAIEQLTKGAQQLVEASPSDASILSRLSVGDLLEIYKNDVKK